MDPQVQNQTPGTPEAPVKHHNFIYILIGLFILLVLGGIFALKYRNESQIQCIQVVTYARNPETGEVKTFGTPCEVPKGWVEVQDQVVDETANWKTYRNEEFGFEFKYPNNVGIVSDYDSSFVGPPTNPEENILLISDKEGTFHFQVNDGKLSVVKKSILGDKVLSTFKFIATSTNSDISTWKTYRNEEPRFEFKYPSEFEVQKIDGNWEIGKTGEKGNIWFQFGFKLVSDNGLNLKDFVKNYFSNPLDILSQENLYSGIFVKFTGVPSNIYFQSFRNNVLVFESRIDVKSETFNQILSTFKFIDKNNQSNNTLIKIYSHGGLCASGEMCESTIVITSLGKITKAGKDAGTVSSGDLNNLISKINSANYEVMLKSKFTGTCPVAYDGQRFEYAFYSDKGEYIIDSCKVAINQNWELFVELNNIMKNNFILEG
ncbi:MAG TPA: hypothetical protein VGC58_00360 [Candidatus Paceibacterota bacterium]